MKEYIYVRAKTVFNIDFVGPYDVIKPLQWWQFNKENINIQVMTLNRLSNNKTTNHSLFFSRTKIPSMNIVT